MEGGIYSGFGGYFWDENVEVTKFRNLVKVLVGC